MFTFARLTVVACFSVALLSGCNDNNNQNAEKASATVASSAVDSSANSNETVAAGTSEKDAIAKLGQPDLTQTQKLDELTITHDEWHTDAGTIAAQFQNGVAKYSQFIAK